MTCRALDMWFGPRGFSLAGAEFFLNYDGKYEDKWDAIFIPVVRAIVAGVDVGEEVVDFTYPAEQLTAEKDSREMVLKRLGQLDNLIPAISQECTALGL